VTYSPQLKLGASTIRTPAKGNLRLTGAPVDCRRPGSFNVNGSVVVTVNHQTTIAFQRSVPQGEGMLLSTTRTGLRRRCETVYFDDLFPPPEGDPFQDAQELSKAQIAHLVSPQGFHPLQVQVFKIQHVVFVAQFMRQLEVVIQSGIRHITAVLCQRPPCPLVTFRAFYLARKLAVQAAGLVNVLGVEQRAGTRSAFIVGQERFETKVEAAALTRAGFANDQLLHHAEEDEVPAEREMSLLTLDDFVSLDTNNQIDLEPDHKFLKAQHEI
jgi:hypothetical protein